MARIFYHGVKARWNDGRSEMLRYDTEEQARKAEHHQFVENWSNTRSAVYVGRRVHWAGLWRKVVGARRSKPQTQSKAWRGNRNPLRMTFERL